MIENDISSTNIYPSQMSEHEKLVFLQDHGHEILSKMKENYLKQFQQTERQKLCIFEEKWIKTRLPRGIEKKSFKILEPLINSFHDMWWKAGLRLDTVGWDYLAEQVSDCIGPWMVRCYFLGYEMAAGNVQREEGNTYLLAAIEPIEAFSTEVIGRFVVKGNLKGDVGKDLLLKIIKQAIDAGNEHIILGIKNYHRVGRWF